MWTRWAWLSGIVHLSPAPQKPARARDTGLLGPKGNAAPSPGPLLTSASPRASAPPPTFLSGMPNVKRGSLSQTVTVVTGVIIRALSQVTERFGAGGLLPETSVDAPSATHARRRRVPSPPGTRPPLDAGPLPTGHAASEDPPMLPKVPSAVSHQIYIPFPEILKGNRFRRLYVA